MIVVNVHEGKTQLSRLLDAAERGEDVYITRRGMGTNRFQLIAAPPPSRTAIFGALKDQLSEQWMAAYEQAEQEFDESIDEWLDSPIIPEQEPEDDHA